MPYYLNVNLNGLKSANSKGDGYTIVPIWYTAYPTKPSNSIVYNIYMNAGTMPPFPDTIFNQPPSFVSIDGSRSVEIPDLIPSQMYHFAVRAAEYDPHTFNFSTLPATFNGLVVLPQSLLAADISATDTIIPLIDVEQFPISGTIKLGAELIYYNTVDYAGNNLIVPGGSSTPAFFVDLGGGQYYLPSPNNVGTGTISNMEIVGTADPTETWTITCIAVQRNMLGQTIPGTAKFGVIGSVSGGTPNTPVWNVYNQVVSNGLISFSIQEISTFAVGDSFIMKVAGSILDLGGRGYGGTTPTIHNTDGYNGTQYLNPNAIFWPTETEETNTHVYECWNRFDIDHFPFNIVDGYHQKTKDILTTNMAYSDAVNTGFAAYDYAGYHRTDPVMLLNGSCIGSYIGGYYGCADGYSGVGIQLRGQPIQDANMQREEVLLSTTGEPVCLVKRVWTGITCDCMLPYNEYPEARCNKCFGTGFVVGWNQFFDQRRSDGRIMVRFSPVADDLIATDSGLESDMKPDCWTLPVPTLKDRDFIIRFDEDGDEEFRYEILNVTRNKLLLNQTGVQKFALQRVRKTDIIYQVKAFRNTSMFPSTLYTSISSSIGIPPHVHQIVINENTLSVSQINQITGISAGHSHTVEHGQVLTGGLGHTHTIILP